MGYEIYHVYGILMIIVSINFETTFLVYKKAK